MIRELNLPTAAHVDHQMSVTELHQTMIVIGERPTAMSDIPQDEPPPRYTTRREVMLREFVIGGFQFHHFQKLRTSFCTSKEQGRTL